MQISDVKEKQRDLNQLKVKIDELYNSIDIEKFKFRLSEMELLVQNDETWKDQVKFTELNQELYRLYGYKIDFYKETEYGTC